MNPEPIILTAASAGHLPGPAGLAPLPAPLPATAPASLALPPVRRASVGEEGADAAAGLSPAKLLHGLRRRWKIAVPLAAAAAVVVYFAADHRLVPTYTARTLVHVTKQQWLLYDNLNRTESANPQRTQIAMVKSRFVGQAAVKDLEPLNLATVKAQSDPAAWLEREIQADYTMAPEILRITLKGSDPDELLLVLNAVRDAYLRELLNRDVTERQAWRKQLVGLAAKDEAVLAGLRKQLAIRAESFGARDLTTLRVRYENLLGLVQARQSELLYYRAGVQRAQLEAVGRTDDAPDLALVETALDRAFAADAVAEGHRKEIVALEAAAADAERRLKNYQADPDYQATKKALVEARTALAARREQLRETALAQARDALKSQKARDADAQGRMVKAAKDYIPQLEGEIALREKDIAALAKGLAELETLRGDVALQEDRVKLANSKVQALDVELQAPPRARVLEEAVVVETPRADRALKLVVAPTLAAFVVVLLLVAWVDVRRGRVDGAEDLEAGNIRVLGAVPVVRSLVVRSLNPPHPAAERLEYLRLTDALDMTRAVLASVVQAVPGFILVVASATAGEGKTVLSAHLAARLARSGRRTLLIDTDVRRPRIHEFFGLPVGPGFGEWVTGAAESVAVAVPAIPTDVPGLDVIPAGQCDPGLVSESLERQLPDLLAELRRDYDVVILDSAPVLVAPESLVLARVADGVLLAVMRDVSRVPGVLAGYERLRAVGARVLGAVVTGGQTSREPAYY